MVAPFILGSALLSATQGIIGLFGASDKKKAAKRQALIEQQANFYELQSAIASGKLEMQAADLDRRATFMQVDAIAQQTATNIFDLLLEGEINARNYEASADADEFNAKVAGQLARNAKVVAGAEASDFRRLQGARLSSNRAMQASSGLAMEGSPMLVDRAAFAEIELGSARLEHAGDVDFFRYLTEQALLERSAKNDRASAVLARKSAQISVNFAKQAGAIARKGAMLGVDASELRRKGADLAIRTAQKKSSIGLASIKVSKKAASRAATMEGISSVVGGFNRAADTLSTGGVKFG